MPSMYSLISAALQRWAEACEARRRGEQAFYVTELARGARGRGAGAVMGRRVHDQIWALDPYSILDRVEWAGPLPLAYRFTFGWVYGVADLVHFVRHTCVAVYEVKSYSTIREYEMNQASLYGLLASLNFCAKPRVYVIAHKQKIEVKDWEIRALSLLPP